MNKSVNIEKTCKLCGAKVHLYKSNITNIGNLSFWSCPQCEVSHMFKRGSKAIDEVIEKSSVQVQDHFNITEKIFRKVGKLRNKSEPSIIFKKSDYNKFRDAILYNLANVDEYISMYHHKELGSYIISSALGFVAGAVFMIVIAMI